VTPTWVLLSGFVLLLSGLQDSQPFNQRPADVTIVISTSRGGYDGQYTTSNVAQVCGEVPKEMNFAGVPTFIVQFPDAADGEVQNVAFRSPVLIGTTTTTTSFMLNVGVKSPRIGAPPIYVLDTAQPKMSGKATLASPSPGTTQLRVEGVNDKSETIHMTVTCGPRSRG